MWSSALTACEIGLYIDFDVCVIGGWAAVGGGPYSMIYGTREPHSRRRGHLSWRPIPSVGHYFPVDDHGLHLVEHLKGAAIGEDQVGVLAGFQGAHAVRDAGVFGGV